MIQRRQFLSAASATTLCLTLPSLPAVGSLSSVATPLNWESTEIKTVRHGKLERVPVVTGVALQQEGNLLAIVGDDHFVSLYDIRSGQYVEHLKRHSDWVRAAHFSPDGTALYTCGNDRKIIRWETDELTMPAYTIRRSEAIIDFAISSDSAKLATVGFNEDLIIHDAEDGVEIAKLKCACNDNHAVAFSNDDRLVAVGGRSGSVKVWDLATQKTTNQFKAHRRRIRSLEFMEDGRLISASDDQTIRINDLSSDKRSFSLPRHASKLFATKIVTPTVIATGGSDNKIHIWNTLRQSEVGSLEGHTGTVSCLAMAQGLIISGSFDTTVRIWQPKADELAALGSSAGVLPANERRAAADGFLQRR